MKTGEKYKAICFFFDKKLILAFETKKKKGWREGTHTNKKIVAQFSSFGTNLILYTCLYTPSNSISIPSLQWLKCFTQLFSNCHSTS